MLDLVKLALRVSTDAFDDEIELLISDCLSEMYSLGIAVDEFKDDPQIRSTVVAYCKWKFGDAENKGDFMNIYHTKIAQLQMMEKYNG